MQIWREDYIPEQGDQFLNICVRLETQEDIQFLLDIVSNSDNDILKEIEKLINERKALK